MNTSKRIHSNKELNEWVLKGLLTIPEYEALIQLDREF